MEILRNITPVNIILGQQQQRGTMEKEDLCAHKISEYELTREERIKENRERMQKLGIVDLSLKLNALNPTRKRAYERKTPQAQSPLPPSGPVRRSSRLQNSTPISYCESHATKKENYLNNDDFLREEGSKPEVYTEEHERMLGSIEKSWTLFVDGYGKDGKRIYDQVKGKTCHQCRQKTLGHRTCCSQCNMVQGQFCGDCLYMRYGENVLEANENPNWICPVCRGICNCSLCRQAKGWCPTGTLYRKISSLGYKSVAHYLIQTRRADADSDKNVVPASAKRSLPFSNIETTKGDNDHSISQVLNDQIEYPLKPEPEKNAAEYDTGDENKEADSELEENNAKMMKTTTTTTIEPPNDSEIKKEKMLTRAKKDSVELEESPESIKKQKKKRVRFELTTPDSIAGRLRQRHDPTNTGDEKCNAKYGNESNEITDVSGIASRLKMRRRA
ncbi:hypothetical protein OROMI_029838 [Orobanche minor]